MGSADGGGTGGSLGGRIELAPRRKRSKDRAKRRQEKSWKEQNGPVTVSYLPGYEPDSDA
mgnify:CR=1 FL=1